MRILVRHASNLRDIHVSCPKCTRQLVICWSSAIKVTDGIYVCPCGHKGRFTIRRAWAVPAPDLEL